MDTSTGATPNAQHRPYGLLSDWRCWLASCCGCCCAVVLIFIVAGIAAGGKGDGEATQSNTTLTTGCASPPCRKILALHGGGQSGGEFRDTKGMVDLVSRAGASYEFVFLTGPHDTGDGGSVWLRDSPGGKDSPTTDPNWDADAMSAIDAVVAAHGPFYGILGYSQGTAITISYLAHAPNYTFQVGLAFCAYIPTTHDGIENRINAVAPLSIPMYVYMSTNDWIIDNCQTNEFASKFSAPTRATSKEGGHFVPTSGAAGFDEIFTFLFASHSDGSYTPQAPTSSELPNADCPSRFGTMLRSMIWFILLGAACCLCCLCGCIFACVRSGACYCKGREDVNMVSSIKVQEASPLPIESDTIGKE